jgi:sugar phosphate permease
VSVVTLFYGWGSLPVGYFADRMSKKAFIMASMILCGLSAILINFSQTFPLTALGFIALG